jgi:hypothetical protein
LGVALEELLPTNPRLLSARVVSYLKWSAYRDPVRANSNSPTLHRQIGKYESRRDERLSF